MLVEIARLERKKEELELILKGQIASIAKELDSDSDREMFESLARKVEGSRGLTQDNTSIYTDFQNDKRWV